MDDLPREPVKLMYCRPMLADASSLEVIHPKFLLYTDKLVYEFLMHLSCNTGDTMTFVSVGDIKPFQCVSVVFCTGMS